MVWSVEFVERAMERARRVFPVPGGPYRRIPRGGFSPVLLRVNRVERGDEGGTYRSGCRALDA